MVLPSLLYAALLQASPPTAAAPPAFTVSLAAPAVLSFRAGRARCESGEERLLLEEPPNPLVGIRTEGAPAPGPIRLSFRIDETGRPLGIAEPPRTADPVSYYPAPDLAAALAASRFKEGKARTGCTIHYEVRASTVEEAEMATLYRLVGLGLPAIRDRAAIRAIDQRTRPAGSTCFDPPLPYVRQRAYPAFEQIPQRPGTLSHSFIAFDIDASGQPINLRLVDSGGNGELDRQSLDAVRRSRFSPVAKRGCTYSYWRGPEGPLPAPPLADRRGTSRTCGDLGPWSDMDRGFPPAFERRSIEGWALIQFDVEPAGAVTNVRALAAEPAAIFGEQAVRLVGNARRAASPKGHRNCIRRLRFRTREGPQGVIE